MSEASCHQPQVGSRVRASWCATKATRKPKLNCRAVSLLGCDRSGWPNRKCRTTRSSLDSAFKQSARNAAYPPVLRGLLEGRDTDVLLKSHSCRKIDYDLRVAPLKQTAKNWR